MKVSAFIATSLDGFIARKDGRLDWLEVDSPAGSEDLGFGTFLDSVDCLVMGRVTYQTVLGFGQWPYGDRQVVVLSSTPNNVTVPTELAGRVTVTSETPEGLVARLASEGKSGVYADGGRVIQSFLRAGLLDELTVTRIPVLIGSGIPLFGDLDNDLWLDHRSTVAFGNGFVQSSYVVRRQ